MCTDYLPYLLALSLLMLLHATAGAEESGTGAALGSSVNLVTAEVAPESAAAVIADTVGQVLSRLGPEEAHVEGDPHRVYALVNEIVVPHLDMSRMARIVLGKHARNADPAAFAEFTREFQVLLVRTYATSLMAYGGEAIDVGETTRAARKGTASVRLKIHRADEAPIDISFRTHNKSGPWLVYDIQIEGISLVSNYRSEFSSIVRKQGIEALISDLKRRNQRAQTVSI